MRGLDSKPHVGLFGRRNTGKSSLINVLTGQETALVSPMPGTTTDPVRKSMELIGIGPVVLIDTAGIDDSGELGSIRAHKSREVLSQIDAAILVLSADDFDDPEIQLLRLLEDHQTPYFLVHNKSDLTPLNKALLQKIRLHTEAPVVEFSAISQHNLDLLLETLRGTIPASAYEPVSLLEGIIHPGETVILITPIDAEAPQGRMILPQVRAIRDIIDHHALCLVVQEAEADEYFQKANNKPSLVITDSQAFSRVMHFVPPEVPLTSFSIAYAHMRGPFETYIEGARTIQQLKQNDRILILESCTHQISCEDIGRVKIPRWLETFTEKKLQIEVVAGLNSIPRPPEAYALVIQCGGCMITRRQVFGRLAPFLEAGVPVTNYGMAIAAMNGLLDRVVQPFVKHHGPM